MAVVVAAAFNLSEQPPFEPSVRVRVMTADNVANTHENAATISQNGIQRAARVMRCGVPVPANQDRYLRLQIFQMIENSPHLQVPVMLRRMCIQVQGHRATHPSRMLDIRNDRSL